MLWHKLFLPAGPQEAVGQAGGGSAVTGMMWPDMLMLHGFVSACRLTARSWTGCWRQCWVAAEQAALPYTTLRGPKRRQPRSQVAPGV